MSKKVNGVSNPIPTINGESNHTSVDEFEPLWDFILFEPIVDNKTKGGLVLPDGATVDSTMRGLVLKSGPGAYRDDGTFVPNPIKVGDMVYHLSFRQPFKVIIDGKMYLCLSGRDCVAIVKRKEEQPSSKVQENPTTTELVP